MTDPGEKPALRATPTGSPVVPDGALPFRRVLVVDDEPDVCRVVAKRLLRMGCEVDTAPDGQAALELLKDGSRYDVILTDQTMPRRTGEEFLLAMREAGLTIPAVMMSGYSATVTPERAIAAGARGFLAKPFDGAELVAALTRAVTA